ncbi:hypothetical protein G159_12315 [Planococcus glaciei CHR43]|nr:hypothetical protein G159_12315 [Planococcus glaciei CHR43]
MALFAMDGETEAAREAGHWSLDTKKSGSSCVGATGISQTEVASSVT